MLIHKVSILSIFVLSIAVSCVPHQKLVYVKTKKNPDQLVQYTPLDSLISKTIQPGDELYIKVTSFDEGTNDFNPTGWGYFSSNDITLISYTVNEKGSVRLPYLGNVRLVGLTLDEAADYLNEMLKVYVNRPVVNIKFVNKKITILGEVNHPGVYHFYDKNVNIFQSLGYANDITEYGNRKKVLIIREENNLLTKKYLDLTDERILNTADYIIKPNDIIYVEPMRRKKWGMSPVRWDVMFSLISTTLLIMSYIKSGP